MWAFLQLTALAKSSLSHYSEHRVHPVVSRSWDHSTIPVVAGNNDESPVLVLSRVQLSSWFWCLLRCRNGYLWGPFWSWRRARNPVSTATWLEFSFPRAMSAQQSMCGREHCRDALVIFLAIWRDIFFELLPSVLPKLAEKGRQQLSSWYNYSWCITPLLSETQWTISWNFLTTLRIILIRTNAK